MKNDVLKTLAIKAKNRMINKGLRDTYAGSSIRIIQSEDVTFYNKVKEMMNDNEDVHNPLQRLMDENKLMKLDARGKEKYLLETIEKYQHAKSLLEKERSFGN